MPAIPCDFIVLDSLRRANESRIPHIPVAAGLNILFALFYQPFHRFAGLSAWFFAQCLKDLFKSADMALSLFEMTRKGFLQLRGIGRLRHFWQGLEQLRFRAVEIAKFVQVKVAQCFECW